MTTTKRSRKHLRSLADEKGFLYKGNNKKPSVVIFEDGTLLRADVDLHLAYPLTVTEAYQILNINKYITIIK